MLMDLHTVIFLCSIHGDPGPTLKQTINNGMRTFQVETRRQPKQSNLCGLYVMRHIYDIVTDGRTKFGAKRFACAKPFSDDEVEHIRDVFCEYLYNQLKESGQ
ncbi:hypothetical protein K1719_032499 [Acacia pycnantha]|nr:hypothetical protein K1719_032499 [Acacia pycnantha]